MTYAQQRNVNPFSILDSLDPPPPNELHKVIPQRTLAKAISHNSIHDKLHRNVDNCNPQQPVQRQNGSTRPGFAGRKAPSHRPEVLREKTFNCYPASVPPQFRNNPQVAPKAFSNPVPLQSSGPIDPCLTPTLYSTDTINAALRKQLLLMQTQSPTSPVIPMPMPQVGADHTSSLHIQRIDPPILPNIQPGPILPKSNHNTAPENNILSSTSVQRVDKRQQPPQDAASSALTNVNPNELLKELGANIPPPPGLTRRVQQQPHIPEVVLCTRTPTSASDLMDPSEGVKVSIPPPPGLPRWGGRGGKFGSRGRISTRPANGQRQFNQAAESSAFERHNGPIDTGQVISPLLSGAPPNLKLPASKNAQSAPNSPATSVSSLTENLSGSSSAPFGSDTTFTSVDSNVSDKVLQRPAIPAAICRRWMSGFSCYKLPCRFYHPPRPNQPGSTATQPPQTPSDPPNSSGTIKKPVDAHEHQLASAPRTRDPPKVNVEPSRPDPLYATTISDHIKVRFDQGFEVKDVVTGFESRWVHIGNLAGSVTSAALNQLLSPYKVDNITLNESSGKPTTAKVQFITSEEAMKAVTDLNGTMFLKRTINAKLAINNSSRGGMVLTDTDVQLVWECPFRVGYAGYDTLKEARVALDTLNGALLEHLVVTAQLYEGLPCVGAYNVMFKQLPASVNEQSLRKFAKSNAVMLQRPNYESLDKAIHSLRSRLEEYGTIASFDVIPAPYKDGMVKAWARFTSPAEARAAQEDMDRRRPKVIGHTTLSCRHVVSVSHTLSSASYRRMREDIGWLRWSWQRRYGPSVSIREKCREHADEDTPAFIRLSSEQPELLSGLKYEFEQLLHGETVTFSKKPAWDDFLVAEAGRAYIAQVEAQYPGVEIQAHKTRRVVSLWGPVVMRHRARQDIVRKIVELKSQQFWKIPLSGKLLSIFRSAELTTLQELLGAENCILDFGERVLVVRGNDSSFRTACDAVQAAQSRQSDETCSSDNVCPVCFGEAVVPVSLACGHQWCRVCLTGYLASAVENKMFPLKCLGNDATCTQCIPLGLSRKLLSAADFNAVIEAAFWVYVHSRSDEFHHCPTPDCTQVYRSAPPNSVLQCPSCLVRICPSCRIKYHDGMTCEERDVAEDKLFNEWSKNHDVKCCPGCKVPIERSEGCNHMTCTRCQTHICWECMATFPRGDGIYNHMRIQHGGIGL